MLKASNLERQASNATARFDAMKGLSPEGAPIAWFPPRMKAFFASQHIDRVTAKMENNAPFKEPELSSWVKYTWVVDIPQTDFRSLGNAVAALENSEPLLSVTKVSIKASADVPEFQQVTLAATTTLLKR